MYLSALVARWYIAITFAVAAIGKGSAGELEGALGAMGMPSGATRPLSRLLAALEATIAIAVCFSAVSHIAAATTVGLVLFFMVVGLMFRSKRIPCACFGSLTRDRLGWSTVWKNIPLLLAALLVWFYHPVAEGLSNLVISFLTAAGLCLMLPLGRYLWAMPRRMSGAPPAGGLPAAGTPVSGPLVSGPPVSGPLVHALGGAVRPLFAHSARRRLLLVTTVGCKYCSWVYANIREIQDRHPDVQVSLLVVANSAADVREAIGPQLNAIEPLWSPFRGVQGLGLIGFPFGMVVTPEGQVLDSGVVTNLAQVGKLLRPVRAVNGGMPGVRDVK